MSLESARLMPTGYEVIEQSDTRFGRRGIAAWVYYLWPLGPLPGALISAWVTMHFLRQEDSLGEVVVFLLVFIFCVWMCSVGILVTKEAFSTAQRIEVDENRILVCRFLGPKIFVDRDEQMDIVPIRISRTRKILTLWTGLLSGERDNWRVRLGSGKAIVMNGEFFDPYSIFRKSESRERKRSTS
jgi:MFS family permease